MKKRETVLSLRRTKLLACSEGGIKTEITIAPSPSGSILNTPSGNCLPTASVDSIFGQIASNHDIAKLNLPKDKKLLAAIGCVAAAAANLDYVITLMRGNVEDTSMTVGKIVDRYLQNPTSDKIKNIKRIVGAKDSSWKEIFQKFGTGKTGSLDPEDERQENATYLLYKRNKLLHHPWVVDKEGNLLRKGDDLEWESYPTVDELNKLANKIFTMAMDINTLRKRVRLPRSPACQHNFEGSPSANR